ncbi:nitrous oxide reductase family maturation protein NosD [Paenibacillus solisilvae]|uniref:Nitrous oxide reductase family maturation protein NosD n=1 Tax=Paenibacillus solisilvae TaxID=2486751 RepID=A0ABW0W5B6_9BACL
MPMIVDVKLDYQAAGDGINDDTQAIQAAIDQVAEGGTVLIPPGVYRLTKNMKNKQVTGYGTSYSALKISRPVTILMEGAVFETETSHSYGVFWIYQASEVHLKGGSLKGDVLPADGIWSSRIGVLIQNSHHCSIEDMETFNYSQGINIYNSEYCTVRSFKTSYNMGSGIICFGSKYSLIDSCTISSCGDGHLSLFGGGQHNTVVNCFVSEDRPGYSSEQGITLERERNSLIKNNTVNGFYYGIDIKNGSDSCTIESNRTYNNQNNIAIRPGDGGGNGQAASNNISLKKNVTTNPRGVSPNASILIKAGTGHTLIENTINKNKLVLTGGILLNSNIITNQYKLIANTFID